MDESYPCCGEVLRWNMAFRIGVRQALDHEQVPTSTLHQTFSLTSG